MAIEVRLAVEATVGVEEEDATGVISPPPQPAIPTKMAVLKPQKHVNQATLRSITASTLGLSFRING
jgi:hypothetical protein